MSAKKVSSAEPPVKATRRKKAAPIKAAGRTANAASARTTAARATKVKQQPLNAQAKATGARSQSEGNAASRRAAAGKTVSKTTGGVNGAAKAHEQPHGRDEIVESIIDATLSLWASQGPAKLSLRGIAKSAGVNYGLVHRHFGTKDEVIRAAMTRRLENGLELIEGCSDLVDVMDVFLDRSTGSYARLLAWATLQYVLEDILPPQDLFLKRVLELASKDHSDDDPRATAVLVGSLIAMAYGWRLFEPYLVPELGLQSLSRAELDSMIREVMVKIAR